MSKQSTGHGYLFESSGSFHTRFYIRIKGKRVQKSVRVCSKDAEHTSKESVIDLATEIVKQAQDHAANQEQTFITGKCPTCGRFTKKE